MLKIGITGGIGSGKTTVSRVFELLGIPVFYADDAAKAVMHTDELLAEDIRKTFGDNSYNSDHSLNRKYIADIVFNNELKLAQLNALVHPAVFRAFDAWLAEQKEVPYILKEAALLFESGSYKACDKTILVVAPEELKIQRIMRRDHLSASEVKARIDKQWKEEEAIKLADFVVRNDEKEMVIGQVLRLHEIFVGIDLVR